MRRLQPPQGSSAPTGKPLLAPAAEKKLLAKLLKTDDAESATKLLVKAAPGGDFKPLLADLALRQQLTLDCGVIEVMQQVAAELEPAAIHGFLDGFGQECAAEPPSDYLVLNGFGENELVLLERSYQQHPEYWNTASLSEPLNGALNLVRARAGQSVEPGVRDRLVQEMVAGVLTFSGLPDNAFALGITPEDWGRKTLPLVEGSQARNLVKPATVEALVQAPWDEVKRILARTPFHGPSFVQVVRRRTDDPKDLLALADKLYEQFESNDECGYLVMAVLPRIAADALALPDSWDALLAGTVVWFARDRDGFAEAFAGAERSISVERRHRIIRAALQSDDGADRGHFAYALLRHAWDDALFADALAGLKNKPNLAASVHHDESESLGLVGQRALPRLVQELEAAKATPQTGVATALWHSILTAAAATAQTGELASKYLDVLVDPGFNLGSQAQFYRWRTWQSLLRALPRPQADAVVASWKSKWKADVWESCIPGT